ncbi:peptidoglycan hydrolase-like protein with peptidoglycan-binding domain [Luteococcus japonicus]|uniref:Peptidoglycan hydrolase-like protein with peptidoglycan-binding domain n=1 Tax=Luteococcus japonicus TaxID=33984 RepID=A0A3N1ZTR5_9ACTN|nr:peptidoglycan-binding protein [Luteococcus japonicus]ROR54245.1 peptidoglycan hydrolase-like protein with peptidoglycan-binding domain [Luteococcus japonicus]
MTTKISRAVVAAAAAAAMMATPSLTTPAHAAPMPSAPIASPNAVVAKLGSRGATVKSIQYNLYKVGLLSSDSITSYYGTKTQAAVKKFQDLRGRKMTGVVTKYDYALITKFGAAVKPAAKTPAAKKPTSQNTVVAKLGSRGATVKSIQYNLYKVGLLSSDSITSYYGTKTQAAVKKFQDLRGRKMTGVVTKNDYALITKFGAAAKATKPRVRLDGRCLTGRAICIDKGDRKMYWVINGSVKATYQVRTGRASLPTRSGSFQVYLKHPNWYSTLYHVYMPYTMFFSGGQAVHYSSEFARIGYSGAGSHGCVNMNSRSDAKWLYSQVRVGDKVIVTA